MNKAKETLNDPEKRKWYDIEIELEKLKSTPFTHFHEDMHSTRHRPDRNGFSTHAPKAERTGTSSRATDNDESAKSFEPNNNAQKKERERKEENCGVHLGFFALLIGIVLVIGAIFLLINSIEESRYSLQKTELVELLTLILILNYEVYLL